MTALARSRASDPDQADYLGKADRASYQLLAIIDDILDISRIEAERLNIDRIEFRLGRVFNDLLALSEQRVREKGLRLETAVAPTLADLGVRGDPMRLGQVLLNLVSNAVKFTPGGAIGIRVLRLAEDEHNIQLRFEVEDTGIGVAAADRTRIFRAFEQVDASMTRKYGGTGLGLAISKRLVEAMGGEIGVDSEPGKGSCFWFTVKLEKSGAMATSTAPSEEEMLAACANARVLLVEDDPMNQAVTREILEGFGMAVDLAADGQQAVELTRRVSYDLILMDIQMPNMDGLEATRRIRELPDGADRTIIATTANAYDGDRKRCLDAGMDDYLAKPHTPKQLLAACARGLARRSPELAG
jgi:CheY-like chemotaxis protein